MTQAKRSIPEGLHTVTPHLVVKNAAAAIEFYKKAFGAQERSRFDQQPPVPRRLRGPKAQRRNRGTLGDSPAQSVERLRPHQRRVGEDHQDVIVLLGNRLAGFSLWRTENEENRPLRAG